jgi:hypothetical protein
MAEQGLPWNVDANGHEVRDANGLITARCYGLTTREAREHARRIVQSVNAESSLSALREQVERIKGLRAVWREQVAAGDAWRPGQPCALSSDELGQLSHCLEQLDALIDPPVGAHHQQEEQK